MAYKEMLRVEISEVIRRWRADHSQRHIASGTGLSRDTVAKYITAAEGLGVSREGPEPSEEQLSRLAVIGQPGPRQVKTPSEDLLSPWADQIYRWLTGDRLQLTRIRERCWRSGAAGCRMPPCSASWPDATGEGAARPRCGWRTPRLAGWRRWTSAGWA